MKFYQLKSAAIAGRAAALSGRMPNKGNARSNMRCKEPTIDRETLSTLYPSFPLCGGWRPLRATALPANASQKYALNHRLRWYNFAIRKSHTFSAFWKRDASHFKKPSAYADTHIGPEGKHLKCSFTRLNCNFGLLGALFFRHLQRP